MHAQFDHHVQLVAESLTFTASDITFGWLQLVHNNPKSDVYRVMLGLNFSQRTHHCCFRTGFHRKQKAFLPMSHMEGYQISCGPFLVLFRYEGP